MKTHSLSLKKKVKYVFLPCTFTRNWFLSLVQTLDLLGTCSKEIIGMSPYRCSFKPISRYSTGTKNIFNKKNPFQFVMLHMKE